MTTADRLTMSLGEAMFTQRAIRRLKPDPIPDDVMRDIMEAAIRAPNGGNTQQWHFIVVKDAVTRKQLGELYHEAWWAKRKDAGIMGPEDIPPGQEFHAIGHAVGQRVRRRTRNGPYLRSRQGRFWKYHPVGPKSIIGRPGPRNRRHHRHLARRG